MKITDGKNIYEVVDYLPKEGQIGRSQADILLKKNHQADGGKWAEVEEIKPKRTRKKKTPPKEETNK